MSIETVRAISKEIVDSCKAPNRPKKVKPGPPYVVNIKGNNQGLGLVNKLKLLAEQLENIDPDDFPMSHRVEFLEKSRSVLSYSRQSAKTQPNICNVVIQLSKVLPHYAGKGSGGVSRDFTFILSTEVRTLVERDFEDLEHTLLPNEAWKSAIIMCGSILEAVLYDQLRKDEATAMASSKVPMRGPRDSRRKKDIASNSRGNSWSLENLIDVAIDVTLIPADSGAIHTTLRRYRNFVHPRVEIRLGVPAAEGPARSAHGMLMTILDHLS